MRQKTSVDKFSLLTPFHKHIFSSVKKSCRNEHLRVDRQFFKKWFGGKNYAEITVEDLTTVYPQVIAEGHESLAEFIVNRWLLRHMDIYHFFEKELQKINSHIEHITEIPLTEALKLQKAAVQQFGPVNTYIFTIFNEVAFPEVFLEGLRKFALQSLVEEYTQLN